MLCTSRYVSTFLDFELPAVRARCEDFSLRCPTALGLRGSAFHLELLDTGEEPVFL